MTYDTKTQQFTGQAAKGVTCWCGVQFAIPETLHAYYVRQNERQPKSFTLYCPLGHGMVPTNARSEAERLRDQLAQEKHRAEQARAEAEYQRRRVEVRDRQLAARKGQITKLRKRIEAGICPCCDRTFPDLHQHMTAEHPDWKPEQEDPEQTPEAPTPTREPKRAPRTSGLASLIAATKLSDREIATATGYAKGTIKMARGGHYRSASLEQAVRALSAASPGSEEPHDG